MSDPDRDRRLARQPRYGARRVAPIGETVDRLLGGEAAARMRRFARVARTLNRLFDERLRARLRPVSLIGGTLTLEVADGPLLAELRQHRAHELQEALIADGAGVDRIVWRATRTTRRRPGIAGG